MKPRKPFGKKARRARNTAAHTFVAAKADQAAERISIHSFEYREIEWLGPAIAAERRAARTRGESV